MHTIKSAADFEHVFKEGRRVSGPLFTAIIVETSKQRGQDGRVAFAAGKKLGNAVFRNRCKRVLRAGAWRAGAPWSGHDVILLAKRRVATASATEVDKAFSALLRKARF